MNYGRKIIKNCLKILSWLCVAGPGVLICVPPLLLFCGSLADEIEWGQRIAPLLKNNQEYIEWKWIPDYPTLGNFLCAGFSGIVLEFRENGGIHSWGTISGGCSCGMGLCRVPVPGKTVFIFRLCHFDAAAVPKHYAC